MPFDNPGAMLGGGQAGFEPSPAADEFLKAQVRAQAMAPAVRPGFVNPAESMPNRGGMPQIGQHGVSGFNPYGGPGLGQDVFSQGLSTLGTLPSMEKLQGMLQTGPSQQEELLMMGGGPAAQGAMEAMRQRGEQRRAAAGAFSDLLGKYAQGSEALGRNQLGAGDLALRGQLGLGELGVKEAAESRLQHGELNKAKDAFIAGQLAKGSTPDQVASGVRAWDKAMGQPQVKASGQGMVAPGGLAGGDMIRGGMNLNTDKLSGETPAQPWTTEQGDLMESIHQKAGKPVAGPAGPTTAPPSVGEFLQALDTARPGMIRENPDTVMSWARSKFGEKAFQDWFQATDSPHFNMGFGTGQIGADEGMRAALRSLMAERGNPVPMRAGGPVGSLLGEGKTFGAGLHEAGSRIKNLLGMQ